VSLSAWFDRRREFSFFPWPNRQPIGGRGVDLCQRSRLCAFWTCRQIALRGAGGVLQMSPLLPPVLHHQNAWAGFLCGLFISTYPRVSFVQVV
jgi:hypothetical protein